MRAQKVVPRKFEFYLAELDNLILVENLEDGGVVVRATRDNVSDQRKMFFIRELANEGFIPDLFQWWNGDACGLTWRVDRSWLSIPSLWRRRARKFMVKLLVLGGVLWLAAMRLVYVSQPGYSHGVTSPAAKAPQTTGHFDPAKR